MLYKLLLDLDDQVLGEEYLDHQGHGDEADPEAIEFVQNASDSGPPIVGLRRVLDCQGSLEDGLHQISRNLYKDESDDLSQYFPVAHFDVAVKKVGIELEGCHEGDDAQELPEEAFHSLLGTYEVGEVSFSEESADDESGGFWEGNGSEDHVEMYAGHVPELGGEYPVWKIRLRPR